MAHQRPCRRRSRRAAARLISRPAKVWERVKARAGLEDVRIHDLRHSFAAVAAGGGESLLVKGKILGHSQAATTERYAHLGADPVKEAADRISGEIAATLERRDQTPVIKIDC